MMRGNIRLFKSVQMQALRIHVQGHGCRTPQ